MKTISFSIGSDIMKVRSARFVAFNNELNFNLPKGQKIHHICLRALFRYTVIANGKNGLARHFCPVRALIMRRYREDK